MKTNRLAFCLINVLLAVAGVAGLTGCGKNQESAAHQARYHCPMHPTYTSDRPGDCPICGMSLVPIKEAGADPGAAAGAEVPGRVAIMVSPEKRQTIGLVTSPVEKRPLETVLRATAVVRHDESRLSRIAPRFGGWVRSLQLNYVGQPVDKGQPVLTVYSPELFTAETEYLLAVDNARQLDSSPAAEQKTARAMIESARRRLELLQIGPEEIRELEKNGRPSEELVFRSPVSGHVLAKNAVEGKAFMAGDTLFEIADLSHVWLVAAVPENDLYQVRKGQKARAAFPALGGKTYETAVTFVSPHIDPQTRRGEARLELDNPDHEIRPEMWANVEFKIDLGEALTIPASAILDTGTRVLAFVDGADRHLEPRELKVGGRTQEYVQVLGGLKEGEKVVTRALFLIDSESQLRAAIAGMGGAGEHQH